MRIGKCRRLMLILSLFLLGCSQTLEVGKVLWGSSKKALEEARVDAMRKTYACSYDECYEAVLSLNRENIVDTEEVHKGFFDIFMKDRMGGYIIVMGIVGNVDTTEAGIFFSPAGVKTTIVEISSLSSSAKRKVSEAVFSRLDADFLKAQ